MRKGRECTRIGPKPLPGQGPEGVKEMFTRLSLANNYASVELPNDKDRANSARSFEGKELKRASCTPIYGACKQKLLVSYVLRSTVSL